MGLDEQGSVISGSADLVVATPVGIWIIDHKSDRVEDPLAAFLRYQPQLECYAKALAGTGCNVLGMAIHWVRRGEVTLAR